MSSSDSDSSSGSEDFLAAAAAASSSEEEEEEVVADVKANDGATGAAGGSGAVNDADLVSKQACTYAALILHDIGMAINEENINKLITAADVSGVKSYWPGLFVKLIETEGMGTILANSIKGGGSGGAAGPAATADGGDAPAEAAAEEEEEEEESSAAAGGMFGGSDSDGSSDDDDSS